MKKPTLLEHPIIFHHMHAGSLTPFDLALYDALECPEPEYGYSIKIYGLARNKNGRIYDLSDGRFVQTSGSDEPPYWQMVCIVEDDLKTLDFVCPAGDEPYWEKAVFTQDRDENRRKQKELLKKCNEMEGSCTCDDAA